MREFIFDIEADGLLDTITKIHCLSYWELGTDFKATIYTKEDIEQFFKEDHRYVGHYITMYDFKALNMIYGIPKPNNFVDTLALSWYLSPERGEHGLESYGDEFGVPKLPIDDWQNLTIEQYTARCERDVEINRILWNYQRKKLQEIYS